MKRQPHKRVNITLTPKLIAEIDTLVTQGNYSSRSEFLRFSANEKLSREQETREAIEHYRNLKGMGLRVGPPDPGDEEIHRIREEVAKKRFKELGWDDLL